MVAGALTLLVVAALAAPLIGRDRRRTRVAPDAANVALYRDQLAELERDRAQGVVSEEQFEQARAELGQRLLADIPAGGANGVEPNFPNRSHCRPRLLKAPSLRRLAGEQY